MSKNILHPIKVPTAPGLEMKGEPRRQLAPGRGKVIRLQRQTGFLGPPATPCSRVAEGPMVSLPFKTWHKELALLGSRFVAPGQFPAANNSSRQAAGFTLYMLSFLRQVLLAPSPTLVRRKGMGGSRGGI